MSAFGLPQYEQDGELLSFLFRRVRPNIGGVMLTAACLERPGTRGLPTTSTLFPATVNTMLPPASTGWKGQATSVENVRGKRVLFWLDTYWPSGIMHADQIEGAPARIANISPRLFRPPGVR